MPKPIRRLAAAAELSNNAYGFITLRFVNWEGGPFDLHPMQDDDGLILPDPTRPAYGIKICGDPDVLERFGKACLTVARNARGSDEPADG